MPRDQQLQPWSRLQAQCCQASEEMQARWGRLAHNAQRNLAQAVDTYQQAFNHATAAATQEFQKLGIAAPRAGHGLAFASLSLGSAIRSRRPQPVLELAATKEEMQQKTAAIPVYTVATKNDEFVFVSGSSDGNQKSMGLFFLDEKDAQDLADKMHAEDPEMAKESHVLSTTMAHVYEFSKNRNSKAKADIAFRFMPDARNVQAALKLFEDAGVDMPGFSGVPVFQASGLTIRTRSSRYSPIFLDYRDLEVAIEHAYKMGMMQKGNLTQAKIKRAQDEFEQASDKYERAGSEDSKIQAQSELDIAKDRLDRYQERLDNIGFRRPDVQVGTLEQLLDQMEAEEPAKWQEVMFIPAGALDRKGIEE